MTHPPPGPTADYAAILPLPVGAAGIRVQGETLVGLDFLPPGTPTRAPRDAPARRVAEALRAYLADPRRGFDLPLGLAGTSFRLQVWRLLQAIPPGQTRTYGDLAMLELLYACGPRVSELTGLPRAAVSLDMGVVKVMGSSWPAGSRARS